MIIHVILSHQFQYMRLSNWLRKLLDLTFPQVYLASCEKSPNLHCKFVSTEIDKLCLTALAPFSVCELQTNQF